MHLFRIKREVGKNLCEAVVYIEREIRCAEVWCDRRSLSMCAPYCSLRGEGDLLKTLRCYGSGKAVAEGLSFVGTSEAENLVALDDGLEI